MSNIDKQALREAAEKAGSDKWQAKKINGDFYVIRSGSYEKQYGITSYQPIAEIEHKPVRDYVAAANPATVLALLDELEAKDKRIAELETSHSNLREAMAGIHNTITGGGAYTPLAAILSASKRAYEESAAAAGKGEAS